MEPALPQNDMFVGDDDHRTALEISLANSRKNGFAECPLNDISEG